ARGRLPGLQPARRRLAHRQVPSRRVIPGRITDDPAARAVPRARHRPDIRRTGPAPGHGLGPGDLPGPPGAGLAARRRAGDPGRDRPRPPGAPGTRRRGPQPPAHRAGAGRGGRGGPLMRLLVLSHRDVLAALSPGACFEAMTAVLAGHALGETFMPLRSVMM